MIKATAKTNTGQDLILLGLSRENTRRLHEGQPIRVDTSDLPGVNDGPIVYLLAGETEDDIGDALRELMGPETVIADLRKPTS